MHVRCGGIFNNHFIANCEQSVRRKNYKNWLIFHEDMDKGKLGSFFETV